MHQYISKCSANQPAAYVKEMGPAPVPINPKLMKQAIREAQQMNQPPMSTNDGVTITINISPSGAPEEAGEYIRERSQDILSRAFLNQYQ